MRALSSVAFRQYGDTDLHRDAKLGHAEAVSPLPAAEAASNAWDHHSRTPRHWAATEGVAEALLEAGANPEVRDRLERTPLHYAATAAAVLLRHNADPNARDRNGQPPLYQAASKGVVTALIEAGAEPGIGQPIHWAHSSGAVKVLVASGLNPEASDIFCRL